MAIVAGIKIKPKTKKEPGVTSSVSGEPIWDADRAVCFDDETFDHYLRKSFNFYNYNNTQKDFKKFVLAWLKENTKFTKEQLDAYASTTPEQTPMTLCSLVKATTKGMPMREKHKAYLVKFLTELVVPIVEKAKADAKLAAKAAMKGVVATVAAPTIQERLAEKTSEVIGELEGQVDNAFMNKPIEFKVYDFLTSRGVAQAQVGKIRATFQKQIDEITEFVAGKDKQLVEAYSFMKKADLKRVGDFYIKLMADLDAYTHVKKVQKKIRVKKAPSKEKLIAKVKYAKENKELKIVSSSPADIIGASAVWIYNAKLRKLGRYVASEHNVLGIKGTSITNYDETKSVAKTLRDPKKSLLEFAKSGKVQLRTFLTNIKAVATKMNGRLNEDILILKVE